MVEAAAAAQVRRRMFRSPAIASALSWAQQATTSGETEPLLATTSPPPPQPAPAGNMSAGSFRLEDWREHLLLLDACADLERGVNAPAGSAGGGHEAKRLDFTTVNPYLLTLQLVAASALAALVSVVVPHVTPVDARTALRVLVLSVFAGAGLLLRPAVLNAEAQRVPLHRVFKVLRWGLAFWVAALVAETLAHGDCGCAGAAGGGDAHVLRGLHRALVGVAIAILRAAAGARVLFPTSRSDASVLLGLGALALLALAPQSLDANAAPLSRALGLFDGSIRIVRAAAWALAKSASHLLT